MIRNIPALRPLGYQQLGAGIAAATALTIPVGCSLVVLTAEAQAVRWRDDGTDPTATVGMPLAIGTIFEYTSSQMSRVKFIEQAAGAILNASYYA